MKFVNGSKNGPVLTMIGDKEVVDEGIVALWSSPILQGSFRPGIVPAQVAVGVCSFFSSGPLTK